MTPEEMKRTVAEFKAKYPSKNGLNVRQMRQILDGEVQMVKHSGTRNFSLWQNEDPQPGGKLDQLNAQIRRGNAVARQAARAVAASRPAHPERGGAGNYKNH